MKNALLILIGTVMLSACQLTDAPMWLTPAENQTVATTSPSAQGEATIATNQAINGANERAASVTSLYQNPAIDAEIAASVKDFRLLGYQSGSNDYVTPAVPRHYTQLNIKKGCGIRLVPGAARTVTASFDDKQRESIRRYIERYNHIMLGYCEDNAGKSLRAAYRHPGKQAG